MLLCDSQNNGPKGASVAFHPIVETADEEHLVVPHALPWSPYRPTLARAGLRSAWAALGVIQGRRVRLRPCRAAGRPQTSDGFGWRRLESEGRNDRAWSAPPRPAPHAQHPAPCAAR